MNDLSPAPGRIRSVVLRDAIALSVVFFTAGYLIGGGAFGVPFLIAANLRSVTNGLA